MRTRTNIAASAFAFVLIAVGFTLIAAEIAIDRALKRKNADFVSSIVTVALQPGDDLFPTADAKILNDFSPERDRPRATRASAAQEFPTSALFAEPPVVMGAALSPSGRYLATSQRKGKSSIAVMYDLDDPASKAFGINFKDINIEWVDWASDDRVLIGYSLYVAFEIADFVLIFGGSRVLAADRNGKNMVTLFEGEPAVANDNFFLSSVTHMLPNDPTHVLMPAFKDGRLNVWKVDVMTGGADLVERGTDKTAGWFADKDGNPVVRIDSNKDGDFVRLYARDAAGSWKQFSSGPFLPHRAPNLWPAAPGDKPGELYMLANSATEDRVAMKLYSIGGASPLGVAFAHQAVDVGGALTDAKTGGYLGSWFIEDQYSVAFTDRTLQKHYDGLRRFFENNANVYVRNVSAGKGRFLVLVSGPQDPGDYYIYDYATANVKPLFAARPHLSRELLGRVETLKFKARDGMPLTAYVTHPAAGDERWAAPLVVMPHGGPESRDTHSFDPFAQFLASQGYRVLQPNFRGSSGYGKAFAEAGYREWGGKMQDDIEDAVAAVRDRDLISSDKVCIVGASYGGYAALAGAAKTPDLYRCAVGIAGVYDLPKFLQSMRAADDDESYDYWVRAIGDPSTDKLAIVSGSPSRNAARIKAPVLLIHGAKDTTAPTEQSRIMRDALKTAGKDVRYVEFPNERHSNWSPPSEAKMYEHVAAFLNEQFSDLGRRAPAAAAD